MKETPQERINRKVEAYRLKLQAAEDERQKKIQAQIQLDIKKSNAAYKKAGPAQRRVMIAKDVIKRVEMQQFIAKRGAFTLMTDSVAGSESSHGASLQVVLHNPDHQTEACRVCAIGGLFCSAVSFRNECTLSEHGLISDDYQPINSLKEFSLSQKQLIELAFERGRGFYRVEGGDDERWVRRTKQSVAASDWRYEYEIDDNNKAMIALMKNIIKHKGRFNPLVK